MKSVVLFILKSRTGALKIISADWRYHIVKCALFCFRMRLTGLTVGSLPFLSRRKNCLLMKTSGDRLGNVQE